jgi:hypothetical protein
VSNHSVPTAAWFCPPYQPKCAHHEDANEVRQGPDGAVPICGVTHHHVKVERQGDEDQTRQCRRRASDNEEEVVPLVRPIGVRRDHRTKMTKRPTRVAKPVCAGSLPKGQAIV